MGLGLALAGSLAHAAARIWEIVDPFMTVNEMQAAGKVVVRTVIETGRGGAGVGASLSW